MWLMCGSASLMASSLYFTAVANGNSRMYRFGDIASAAEEVGLRLIEARLQRWRRNAF